MSADATVCPGSADGRLTVDFDHHSPKVGPDPYPVYEELREKCPVAWSEHHGGFWVLTDYENVLAATENDDVFHSAPGNVIPLVPYGIRNVPIDTDSPETQEYRAILLKAYSPRSIERLTPRIVEVADQLIDAFIETGSCDLVNDFAKPLPGKIVLELLGLSEYDYSYYVDRIYHIIHASTTDPDGAVKGGNELATTVANEIADRREHGFRDDQLSMIMQASIFGKPLSDVDVTSYVLMMLFGGLDTSTAALANSMITLDEDRALRQRLIDHPEDLRKAVEELLRYQAPVGGLGRTISRDIEMNGQQLKAGDRALLVWASANRDSTVFDNPDAVNIDRNPNRHLSFGVGLHRCLGSNLGRAMFRIMLERVLARIPDYRLAADPEQYRYDDASSAYTLTQLPATFSPAAKI